MSKLAKGIEAFVTYAKTLKGDEKGELRSFAIAYSVPRQHP